MNGHRLSVGGVRRLPRAWRAAPFLASALAAMIPLCHAAHGADWINPTVGIFSDPANWSTNPSVPGFGDLARFSIPSAHIVNFTDSPTTGTLEVSQGQWAFQAAVPQVYTVSSGITINNASLLGLVPSLMLESHGNVLIDGAGLSSSTGSFHVIGAMLTAQNNGTLALGNGVNIGNNSIYRIQNSSNFFSIMHLHVGDASTGTLLVDGVGSTLTAGGPISRWGANGGTGTVILSHGAVAALGTNLEVAAGITPGTLAVVTVESAARMLVFDLRIAADGGAGVSGNVTVTGLNSLIAQTTSSSLTVGGPVAGSGILTVADGAEYVTGMTSVVIHKTGQLHVNGGFFFSQGTFVVEGGTVMVGAAGTFASTSGGVFLQPGAAVTINGGLLYSANLVAVKPGATLAIAGTQDKWSGQLDVAGGTAIFHAANAGDKAAKIATLVNQIKSGSDGGKWTGQGITSSTAAANTANYGVGLFDNAVLGKTSFANEHIDANSLIVRMARLGDTNIDGVVDINDLGNLASNWQQARTTWTRGDFNYDGFVDIEDLGILASNWQQRSEFPMLFEVLLGRTTAVPEPASLGVLALGLPLLWRRQRRRAAGVVAAGLSSRGIA